MTSSGQTSFGSDCIIYPITNKATTDSWCQYMYTFLLLICYNDWWRKTKNVLKQQPLSLFQINNLLTIQGTAQPITRKKQRRSDVIMRPPSSSSVRRSARRRSSGATLDLSGIVRKETPRTNVLGFLQQGWESMIVSQTYYKFVFDF
jgi:hypothetical protein